MSACLNLQNVSYKNILKDINLELQSKKLYILCGPTGSGKTTFAKCILNLVDYTGKIEKNNINSVSYLGDINLFIKKNVIDNIVFSIENAGIKKTEARKKAYDISKKMGITDLMFKMENELTYSEKKIVMFTMLISKESDLMIIDDPLDINTLYRKKILDYLVKLAKNSLVVFITNKEEDFMLADNIIVINDGKIIKSGVIDELLKDEKLFIKNKLKVPFSYQLSSKLVSYGLLEEELNNIDDIIGKL